MKKLALLFLSGVFAASAYCGAPQAINYQAVAIGSGGAPLKSKSISVRFSITDGPSGSLAYQELQNTSTDNNGLFSLSIGEGLPLAGTFPTITWSKGNWYLKTELDTTGGGSFFTMGTMKFLSVPYAFYAEKAGRTNYSSPDFPDGLDNSTPMHWDGSFSYVVPTGYTLYINQMDYNNSGGGCSDYSVNINGLTVNLSAQTNSQAGSRTIDQPFAIGEGKSISSSACGASVSGFLIAKNHTWVMADMLSGSYKVPTGKVLVIKRFIQSNSTDFNNYYMVDSKVRKNSAYVQQADQDQTISISGLSSSVYLIGYLRDR